jgi:hypothetical protein
MNETKTKETPHEKFWRLGQDRVDAALKAMAEVADLAAPDFDYTEDELQQILNALFDSVHNTKRALMSKIERKRKFRFEV